ncbi:MAG: hypothetical protein H6623_08280 [Bdellovibrionaceae bacterium]|nr:hypothetical protein [Pseudobdellovibrionaceae bacterium]
MKYTFILLTILLSSSTFALTKKLDCTGKNNTGLDLFQIKATVNDDNLSEIQFWSYNNGQVQVNIYENSKQSPMDSKVHSDYHLESKYTAPGYGLSGHLQLVGNVVPFHLGLNTLDTRAGKVDLLFDAVDYLAELNKWQVAVLKGALVQFDVYDAPSSITPIACTLLNVE